jgi:hypothetical protein
MNFDAVVVFVTSQTLLFRLALTLYNVNSKGFLFGFFYVYKNLQNNLTNYAIKSICIDFFSTNMGSSVIGTG